MTVGELRTALETYPDDMPVMAEWEGCHAYMESSNLYVRFIDKGHTNDRCHTLVIDVNKY